ncbi:MAG TPA: methyltransferase domain-containing protein, partial [Candidatus Methylomirabilis sp.]|nr:methyltransferase domain-containing protein [Candidatus Methylomirabilis sp.]
PIDLPNLGAPGDLFVRNAMAQRVCPWWLGWLLASPLRRIFEDPAEILAPYVHEGMKVLEPGPGMGFLTIELARRVGASGRVVAVDIQPRMLDGLKRRAFRAGLLERVDARLAHPDSLGVADLADSVDLVLAFAVVHEMPSASSFFAQACSALKRGACLLLVEPSGHVKAAEFDAELKLAAQAGLELVSRPSIRRSHAALLKKAP